MANTEVKFIRKNGRVIPIKSKKSAEGSSKRRKKSKNQMPGQHTERYMKSRGHSKSDRSKIRTAMNTAMFGTFGLTLAGGLKLASKVKSPLAAGAIAAGTSVLSVPAMVVGGALAGAATSRALRGRKKRRDTSGKKR